ncbi:DUF397 domain-containing protein [Amycolatopsis cihanbeyliensis]|uniref:Uncharacterized protein DUF397 n=1 Tax=Amycolatopsis cihanbeyliensis TaxID=1128664 RepID=A0A542DLD0_AMYCI|nr:DUF397 domain-containing protein [Amycolatopsis cihanbeyliensis]TQJ03888.1 uncharacterized protein DUF397 [Amycolatopsis cihanbeyliensis]
MTTSTTWRKSSYSGGTSNECVELAREPERTLVRDTKNRAAGTLGFTLRSFDAFLGTLKRQH